MTDIDPIRERAFHLAVARYSPVDEIEMVLRDAVAIEAFLRGEWRPAVAVVRGSAGEDVGRQHQCCADRGGHPGRREPGRLLGGGEDP